MSALTPLRPQRPLKDGPAEGGATSSFSVPRVRRPPSVVPASYKVEPATFEQCVRLIASEEATMRHRCVLQEQKEITSLLVACYNDETLCEPSALAEDGERDTIQRAQAREFSMIVEEFNSSLHCAWQRVSQSLAARISSLEFEFTSIRHEIIDEETTSAIAIHKWHRLYRPVDGGEPMLSSPRASPQKRASPGRGSPQKATTRPPSAPSYDRRCGRQAWRQEKQRNDLFASLLAQQRRLEEEAVGEARGAVIGAEAASRVNIEGQVVASIFDAERREKQRVTKEASDNALAREASVAMFSRQVLAAIRIQRLARAFCARKRRLLKREHAGVFIMEREDGENAAVIQAIIAARSSAILVAQRAAVASSSAAQQQQAAAGVVTSSPQQGDDAPLAVAKQSKSAATTAPSGPSPSAAVHAADTPLKSHFALSLLSAQAREEGGNSGGELPNLKLLEDEVVMQAAHEHPGFFTLLTAAEEQGVVCPALQMMHGLYHWQYIESPAPAAGPSPSQSAEPPRELQIRGRFTMLDTIARCHQPPRWRPCSPLLLCLLQAAHQTDPRNVPYMERVMHLHGVGYRVPTPTSLEPALPDYLGYLGLLFAAGTQQLDPLRRISLDYLRHVTWCSSNGLSMKRGAAVLDGDSGPARWAVYRGTEDMMGEEADHVGIAEATDRYDVEKWETNMRQEIQDLYDALR